LALRGFSHAGSVCGYEVWLCRALFFWGFVKRTAKEVGNLARLDLVRIFEVGDDVVVLTISMDLPFAQKRWCGAVGVKNVQILSDHREASFAIAFGVLIKELRLIARAVFVVDRDVVIRYMQIVNELANEPCYQSVLDAVRELL